MADTIVDLTGDECVFLSFATGLLLSEYTEEVIYTLLFFIVLEFALRFNSWYEGEFYFKFLRVTCIAAGLLGLLVGSVLTNSHDTLVPPVSKIRRCYKAKIQSLVSRFISIFEKEEQDISKLPYCPIGDDEKCIGLEELNTSVVV